VLRPVEQSSRQTIFARSGAGASAAFGHRQPNKQEGSGNRGLPYSTVRGAAHPRALSLVVLGPREIIACRADNGEQAAAAANARYVMTGLAIATDP